MKIFIVHFNLDSHTGAPRFAFMSSRAFLSLGHEVSLVTSSFDPACFPNLTKGLDIRVVPQERRVAAQSAGIFRKVKNRLQRRSFYLSLSKSISDSLPADIDILNCQDYYTYYVGFFYKKRNPKAKIVWTVHNPPFSHFPKANAALNVLSWFVSRREARQEKKYLAAIDLVTAIDERHREWIRKLGLPVKLLRSGVDFDYFYAPPKQRVGKSVRLVSAGSLSPYRRFEDTILAVSILRSRGYDAGVVIVSNALAGTERYRDQLLEFTAQHGMSDYARFTFKGISDEELRSIYRASDIFVFPNHIRIWGMAAFEAMAAGVPLIVSDVTSVAEVLTEGEQALFVRPMNPKDIADKAEQLMKDPVLYKKIAHAGQEFVQKELSWEKFAREFLSAIIPNGA